MEQMRLKSTVFLQLLTFQGNGSLLRQSRATLDIALPSTIVGSVEIYIHDFSVRTSTEYTWYLLNEPRYKDKL